MYLGLILPPIVFTPPSLYSMIGSLCQGQFVLLSRDLYEVYLKFLQFIDRSLISRLSVTTILSVDPDRLKTLVLGW